jgi:hypothetical protein
VFQAANLPLVRIPVQASYNTHELEATLGQYLEKINKVNAALPLEGMHDSNVEASIPICPKCGLPMVVRTAVKGEHHGEKFYGCPNFPKCREVRTFPKA